MKRLVSVAIVLAASAALAKTEVREVRVNGLIDPEDVGRAPIVSYKLGSDAQGGCQKWLACRIFDCTNEKSPSCVWTAPVFSNDIGLMSRIVLTNYAYRSATKYAVELQVTDETGGMTAPKRATFVTSLLETNAWAAAKFISAADPAPARPEDPKARRKETSTTAFAKEFTNAKDVVRARLFTSGLGVYEAYVNGRLLGRNVLKPGFTTLARCRHVYSEDVTASMRLGKGERNLVAAQSTGGWWADQIVGFRGKRTAFYAILVLRYADGTEERFGTDATWKAALTGPVTHADIYYGETYDARRGTAFLTDAAASAGWKDAVVNDEFGGELRPVPGAGMVRRDDLVLAPREIWVWKGTDGAGKDAFGRVRKVRTYRPGETMVLEKGETLVADFAQNAAAVPDFTFAADAGTELTVRFAEMLNDANGEKSRGNDGPGGSAYVANMRSCPSRLDYTFAGTGDETYSPRFSFWGYRYVSLTATGRVTVKALRSVPVSSVLRENETGTVVTGNADVNRLVENVRWGMRSNLLSVPTDCPQRDERMGWTADTQVFAETALYLTEGRAFYRKWLADMRDSQFAAGDYPSVAPIAAFGNEKSRLGWADAGVIVPWTLWRMTGDTTAIRESWDSMKRFTDEIAARKYVTPADDSQYADWLSYEKWETCRDNLWGKNATKVPEVRNWWAYLGGCYWLWDAQRMVRMAQVLEKRDDEAKYAAQAAEAMASLRARFMTPDGDLEDDFRDLQTAHLFALHLGLAPTQKAKKVLADRLVALIEKNGNRLSTGFLGTSILMDTITYDVGRPDLAYTLLLQRDCPSWLYSVDQGATTIWERWNSYTKDRGFGPVGMNSFNHYAYGAVAAWLFRTAAGIQTDDRAPGFRRVVLRPSPDRRLGSVDATCDTAYGLVRSAWRYEGSKWIWDVTVPPGAVASAHVPGEPKPRDLDSGTYRFEVCLQNVSPRM